MTVFRFHPALLFGAVVLGLAPVMVPGLATAQQGQQWFVPPQQQPQQQRPPAQRPPAQPARPAAPAAAAQQPPAAVIGIVDIPEVQRVSTAFNQVREEIERRRTRLNEDLQREQTNWREAQQQLASQRAQLTAEQIRARERELQERITDSQRIFRNRSQHIEVAAQQALVQIEESLANIVRQVAQSRSVNLVMPRPLVIMNDPAFDLTEEVAQQFNRTTRQVQIPAESDGSSPPTPPTAQPQPQPQPARPATPPAQAPRR
jgi:Skp family chaperone for outer membrane proteins